jgi:hypothetical protein
MTIAMLLQNTLAAAARAHAPELGRQVSGARTGGRGAR